MPIVNRFVVVYPQMYLVEMYFDFDGDDIEVNGSNEIKVRTSNAAMVIHIKYFLYNIVLHLVVDKVT